MAMDMFLKLDGIKGESVDHKYAGEIDVLSWSWGASNAGTGHFGGGSGSGKVSVQDMSVTKRVDKSSPTILLHVCNGKHIPTATLIVRKSGEKPLEYLKIKMEQVFVTSYSTGGHAGQDDVLHETLSLNFAKVAVDYQEQNKDGSAKGGPVPMTWNIATNTK